MYDFRKSVVYQIYPKSFCDTNGDGLAMLIVTDPGAHSLTTHTGRDVKHGETPVAELG